MFKFRKTVLAFAFVSWVPLSNAVQPEDILGEYWNDPLFGVASADIVQRVEVLHRLLFPNTIEINAGEVVRFVFENKTDEAHIFLFSQDPQSDLLDGDYMDFVHDEHHHATMPPDNTEGHKHAHNTESDDAKSIVGTLSDRPTMALTAFDKREMILSFDSPAKVFLKCILEGHEDQNHESIVWIKPSKGQNEKEHSYE